MKKRFWLAGGMAVAALIVVAIVLVRPYAEQEHPATVIEVVNRVDAHPRPQGDWTSAWVDMRIFGGGQVRTGGESSARLELLEGTVRLSADSVFTVKKSTTHEGTLVTTVFLEHGRLWAYLTSDQPHEFTVETGTAVAAVRDTRLSVQVTDEMTLVSVAEGEAMLTAQEQTVTVRAGEQATVEAEQPPSPPEPMSDQERALWATEGEMPELAPPAIEMEGDVYCALSGPAGNPASRNPWTQLGGNVQSPKAVEVAVESPNGETIVLPRYSDFWGGEGRFHKSIPGLPQAGGTYVFTALDADGAPIPGAVASDVYLGGHEPDPPANVQARVVEDGILVTWNPSPIIPGAFDPGASPPIGFYKLTLWDAEGETLYSWGPADGGSQPETAHRVPFRRQDFAPGASGLALEELEGRTFHISVDAFSSAPEEAAGHGLECEASDPEEGIWIVIEEGRVQIENP
jgi:hypothetical protein